MFPYFGIYKFWECSSAKYSAWFNYIRINNYFSRAFDCRIISYRFRLSLDPMNPCFRTQGMWFCILPSTPKGFKHTLKFVKPYWMRTMVGFQGTFKIWKLQIEFYSIAKEKDYSLLRTSKHMWPQIF